MKTLIMAAVDPFFFIVHRALATQRNEFLQKW